MICSIDNMPTQLPTEATDFFGNLMTPYALDIIKSDATKPLHECDFKPSVYGVSILHIYKWITTNLPDKFIVIPTSLISREPKYHLILSYLTKTSSNANEYENSVCNCFVSLILVPVTYLIDPVTYYI